MKLHTDSHLDHGLTEAQRAFLLERYADRSGFFIDTVELPESLGTVPCGLHGPIMGDEPLIGERNECHWAPRKGREYASRLCNRSPRPVRTVTVIAGPHGDEACVLYTAFGGPLAPKELNDPTLAPDKRAESEAFWIRHALSASEG